MNNSLNLRNPMGGLTFQTLLADVCHRMDPYTHDLACRNRPKNQIEIRYCQRATHADPDRNSKNWAFNWGWPVCDAHRRGVLLCGICKAQDNIEGFVWSHIECYVDGSQNNPIIPHRPTQHAYNIRREPLDPDPWFGTLAEICDPCATRQERQHPRGHNFCVCKAEQQRRWLCLPCAYDSCREMFYEQNARRQLLRRVHCVKGEVRYDRPTPRLHKYCPACGKNKAREVRRKGPQNTKICLLCRNLKVQNTVQFGPELPPTPEPSARLKRESPTDVDLVNLSTIDGGQAQEADGRPRRSERRRVMKR